MQPTDDVPDWLHAKTGDSALAKAWENAKQAGMPWGVVRYRVSASDHTYTDEGLDLGPGRKQRTLPTRTSFPPSAILTPCRKPRRSETPSPSAIDVYQSAVWFYFDGRSMYTTSERMNLFPMTATIEQINHDSAQFMGFETINGAKSGLRFRLPKSA